MVTDNLSNNQNYQSTMESISNVLAQMKAKSKEKQKIILNQDWQQLKILTEEQNQLLAYLENLQSKMGNMIDDYCRDSRKDFRYILKTDIEEYQEVEKSNIKMLNDQLFVAQEKVNHLFKNTAHKKTYNREMKKETNLFDRDSGVLDKVI
ncbi:MAG: hypothetical protein MJB14_15520 [Spirochaetes bacterium]|nr:hypothetical protein [Spirochaetota bacterium]